MVNYLSRRKRPLRLVSNGVVLLPLLLPLALNESPSALAKPPLRQPLRSKHASRPHGFTDLKFLFLYRVASPYLKILQRK